MILVASRLQHSFRRAGYDKLQIGSNTMAVEASDLASPGGSIGPASASDTSAQQPQSKRRRTAAGAAASTSGAASARGVANLTPEQLARKRANDREAQRAIRERTKTQIDSLNRRIHELESQQPYHDLQIVVREKDAVLAENTDIRKRLESVMGILGPIIRGASGLNGERVWGLEKGGRGC